MYRMRAYCRKVLNIEGCFHEYMHAGLHLGGGEQGNWPPLGQVLPPPGILGNLKF